MGLETRQCQNCKKEFTIEPEDFAFYEKIKVPPPTFCPECREERRIAWRNERALSKRKCDLCGKEVVSRVSPDKPYPAYCKECWWSDRWNGKQYGREYDFSKPFFEQFKELLYATPHVSILNLNTVNSDWVNQETDDKNCYLNVGGHYNEDSAYNTYDLYSKDSFDNWWFLNSELGYGNVDCERCYAVTGSVDCFDSQNLTFCFDCRNCHDCFGSAGLRNKQYCIFNEEHTKEEYQKFIAENPLGSWKGFSELRERSEKFWFTMPHRFASVFKSVNSTGNYLSNSKNAKDCWNGEEVEDSKYLYIAGWIKDSYDESAHGASELTYESASGGGVYNSKFLNFCMSGDPLRKIHSSDVEYCYSVIDSKNCFGCANLRNGEYCILNKQYPKEEYEALVQKIRKHMDEMPYAGANGRVYRYGEFFPIELSPYGYNETAAMDYYPLSKSEAEAKGYPWSDYEADSGIRISDYAIPDDIKDVKDDIVEKILKCEASGKPYRVIPMELQFYRRRGLPIPRLSPLERHKARMRKLLPRRLFERTCECQGGGPAKNGYKNTVLHDHGNSPCGNRVMTPYAPDRPDLIYCEECYQKEIV